MTPTLKKKVRHSSKVTACMAYLLSFRGTHPIEKGTLSSGPLEATNDEPVDSSPSLHRHSASPRYALNVRPAVEKSLEMVWRFPGEFPEAPRCAGAAWAQGGAAAEIHCSRRTAGGNLLSGGPRLCPPPAGEIAGAAGGDEPRTALAAGRQSC